MAVRVKVTGKLEGLLSVLGAAADVAKATSLAKLTEGKEGGIVGGLLYAWFSIPLLVARGAGAVVPS